jgi:hypothetical protein
MTDHINLAGETAQKLEREIEAVKLELLAVIRNRSKDTWNGAADATVAAAYAYSVIAGDKVPNPPSLNIKK